MIRRGREKRHPFGSAPKNPSELSKKIAHFDFDPSYIQKNKLGLTFNNSPMQLANTSQSVLAQFGLTRVGLTPGFFVSFWITWVNNGAVQSIIGKVDGIVLGLYDYDLFISAGGVVNFNTYSQTYALGNAFSTVSLVAGTPTLVAINCNYTNSSRFAVEIYINNALRGSYNFAGARRVDNCPMKIGSNSTGSANFLVSTIDQLFIRKNYFLTAAIRNQLYNSGLGCSFEELVSNSGFPQDKVNLGYWKNTDSSNTFWPDRLEGGNSFAAVLSISVPSIGDSKITENFFPYPVTPVPNNGYFTGGAELFSEQDDITTIRPSDIFAGGEIRQGTQSKVPITYIQPRPGTNRNYHAAQPICYFNGTDVCYQTNNVGVDVLTNRSQASIFIVCGVDNFFNQQVFTITTGTGSERFTYELQASGDHAVYLRRQDAEATPQSFFFTEKYENANLFVVRAKIDYAAGTIDLEFNGRPSGSFSLASPGTTDNTNSTLIKIGSGLATGSQLLTIAKISCFVEDMSPSEVQNYYRYIKAVYDVPCY